MTMTLSEAEAAYRDAWEAERLETALRRVRLRAGSLEKRIAKHKTRIVELEQWLADLQQQRADYVEELEGLPQETRHLTAQQEDRIRGRRQDLRFAIAALDGDYAKGTLVDHLWNKPRIPGATKVLAEERELLAKAEAELANARRQLKD